MPILCDYEWVVGCIQPTYFSGEYSLIFSMKKWEKICFVQVYIIRHFQKLLNYVL